LDRCRRKAAETLGFLKIAQPGGENFAADLLLMQQMGLSGSTLARGHSPIPWR
jgi:hypothetical protein